MGDIPSDLASSDYEQSGEDAEGDHYVTKLHTLSDDDETGWLIGLTSTTVQHHGESFQQNDMRLDEWI
jgi:hypothetical protein